MKKNYLLFALIIHAVNNYAQITVRLSDGNKFISNATWNASVLFGAKGTYFADVNGDGKADVVIVYNNIVQVKLSNGNMFFDFVGNRPWISNSFSGTRGTCFSDVNGDGKADAISVSEENVTVRLSDGSQFMNFLGNKPWTLEPYYGTRGTFFADVNGDGKDDAIVINEDLITVRLSDGTKFLPNASWTSEPYYGSRGTFFADVNGDGKADAIVINDDLVTVRLSDGSKFLPNASWTSEPYYGSRGTYFADVNGDGKSDAIVINDDLVTVRLSDGTKFLPNASWTSEPYYGSRGTYFADVNGDGNSDAIVVNGEVESVTFEDKDKDGIDDTKENELLERFRPYYKFSNDGGEEVLHPADAVWFIQHSELFDSHTETGTPLYTIDQLNQDPSLLLQAQSSSQESSDILQNSKLTEYYLNLYNDFRGGDPDWSHIISSPVGLYGHVAPIHENANLPDQITAYKIEYWQLYAHDNAGVGPAGEHEGDWEAVQLIVENDGVNIRTVIHNIHDEKTVFNLALGKPVDIGNGFLEYQGTGTDRPYYDYIDLNSDGPAGIGWAQNNLLRLFCENGMCTHPVVYIEHGAHASWPTEFWSWPFVDNHNGSSYSYLVAVPPNLGEIGYPNLACPGAQFVLEYNGHWGAYHNAPEGPTMKKDQWGH